MQSRVLRVLPPAEAEHALLEVLCTTPPFEVLPRAAKFRAAFRFLDVDFSKGLSIGELKQLLPWLVPQCDPTILLHAPYLPEGIALAAPMLIADPCAS